METIQTIKCLPIRGYLAKRGLHPTKDNPHYGFYLSPFRKECTPSFKVDYTQNLWYDFGLGEGGSIIDLVIRLEGCDFAQAIRLLGNGEKTSIITPVPSVNPPTVPALRVLSDAPIHHPALLDYLQRRGITPSIARIYCREVRYTINGRGYFAIGFPNNAGGWELRSERFKGCVSPKHITAVDNHSDTVIVFEGFMDFLSYLSIKQSERLRIDAMVLNSVINLPKAIPFLERHPTIQAFFDNDEAGRRATAEMMRLCPKSTVVDQSYFYREYKDLNDYLLAKGLRQSARIQPVRERKRGIKF